MSRYVSYLIAVAGLIAFQSTNLRAQETAPPERQMYCSGISTHQRVREDTYIISGPESDVKVVFIQGDKVFINRGAREGVKVGDRLSVSREESDYLSYPWFNDQDELTRQMGTFYADIGILRVVSVQDRTSIAEVSLACDVMQRGDIVQPFFERPAPPFKTDTKLDLYAPPSGKRKGTIVFTNFFGQLAGVGKIVYVNLGTAAGAKVGDYLRIYRYQGEHRETEYNVSDMQYSTFGLGSAPRPYGSNQLPRDILGEGLVLRVSPTCAAVLITNSHLQIFPGDWVEIE